jgi:hypothetical protein
VRSLHTMRLECSAPPSQKSLTYSSRDL